MIRPLSQENLFLGFLNRSDTNQAVQQQKMARGLSYHIYVVEEIYYLCRENKEADQLHGTAALICIFVFTYAKSRFSHDAPHNTPM